MNLARPFKAGEGQQGVSRRVATPETRAEFNRRYATRTEQQPDPGVETPG